MIASLMATMGPHLGNGDLKEDLLRHFVLNSIRSYNTKFKSSHGEMVIATDNGWSWRKEVFPYYKANRKKSREESTLDWNMIFSCLNSIRDDLKNIFPYRVIHVKGAEADDIIGTLCMEYANTNEKILIISGDKDFKQLQVYMNVEQYDPVKKKKLVENQPERFLKEHIMRGDVGDGIPNFLSDDDCLVLGKRQKPILSKKVDEWINIEPDKFEDKMLRGWKRNEQLIDLTMIPQDIRDEIMSEFSNQAGKKRDKLMSYFIEKRLKNLMESISDF